jgi:hypothetical protein
MDSVVMRKCKLCELQIPYVKHNVKCVKCWNPDVGPGQRKLDKVIEDYCRDNYRHFPQFITEPLVILQTFVE